MDEKQVYVNLRWTYGQGFGHVETWRTDVNRGWVASGNVRLTN